MNLSFLFLWFSTLRLLRYRNSRCNRLNVAWGFISLFEVVRLGFHLAENPVFAEEFFLLCQESLQFVEVIVVTDVETESHSGVYFSVVNFLCDTLVESNVVLTD